MKISSPRRFTEKVHKFLQATYVKEKYNGKLLQMYHISNIAYKILLNNRTFWDLLWISFENKRIFTKCVRSHWFDPKSHDALRSIEGAFLNPPFKGISWCKFAKMLKVPHTKLRNESICRKICIQPDRHLKDGLSQVQSTICFIQSLRRLQFHCVAKVAMGLGTILQPIKRSLSIKLRLFRLS